MISEKATNLLHAVQRAYQFPNDTGSQAETDILDAWEPVFVYITAIEAKLAGLMELIKVDATPDNLIEVIEYCPLCDTETVFKIARMEILEQINGKLVCQNCGELLLACSECTNNNCKNEPDCFELIEVDDD